MINPLNTCIAPSLLLPLKQIINTRRISESACFFLFIFLNAHFYYIVVIFMTIVNMWTTF